MDGRCVRDVVCLAFRFYKAHGIETNFGDACMRIARGVGACDTLFILCCSDRWLELRPVADWNGMEFWM